jgi:hypothetical protein
MIVALKDLTRRSVVVSPILRVLKQPKRRIQNFEYTYKKRKCNPYRRVCVCGGSTAVYIERKNRRGKTFAVATAQLNRQLGSVYTLALAPLVVSQRISISGRQCYL